MSEKIIVPGVVTTTYETLSNGDLGVKREQDVEPILEANKMLQAGGFTGYTPSRDMKHVARVPIILMEQWAKEYGVSPVSREMSEVLKRKLNDPEYAYLRTGKGRVG